MGFETVLASEVKIEKNIPPVGKYVFQLVPYVDERPNRNTGVMELNLSAAVAEGEHAGKRVFWAYPDPEAIQKQGKNAGKPMSFSAQAMKKLEIALGVDSLPGETFPEYFRRVSVNGAARFGASIDANKYLDKSGNQVEGDPRFNIFSVEAAA